MWIESCTSLQIYNKVLKRFLKELVLIYLLILIAVFFQVRSSWAGISTQFGQKKIFFGKCTILIQSSSVCVFIVECNILQHQSQKAPKNLLIKNICNCVLPEGTIISRLRGYTYSALNRDQEEGEGGLIIGGRGILEGIKGVLLSPRLNNSNWNMEPRELNERGGKCQIMCYKFW